MTARIAHCHGKARAFALWAVGLLACRHPPQRAEPSHVEALVDARVLLDSAVAPALPSWSFLAPGVRFNTTTLPNDEGMTLRWSVIRVDVSQVRLVAMPVPGMELQQLEHELHVVAAVDGGFFSPTFIPSGLVHSDARTLFPYRDHAGSGTLVLKNERVELRDSTTDPNIGTDVLFALQCGPRLIERDGTVGIYRDDGKRFARTAVCIRDGGRSLDLVTTWDERNPMLGPGLLSLARTLAAASPFGDVRGCEQALNLDGGPSTALHVRNDPGRSHPAVGPVPWALAVIEMDHRDP